MAVQSAVCYDCQRTYRPNSGNQRRCLSCSYCSPTSRVRASAHSAVRKAVIRGDLRNLKVEIVQCTDCDKRATRYDHRDYNKPLEVDPVCWHCNFKRGQAPAIPAPAKKPKPAQSEAA